MWRGEYRRIFDRIFLNIFEYLSAPEYTRITLSPSSRWGERLIRCTDTDDSDITLLGALADQGAACTTIPIVLLSQHRNNADCHG